MSGNSLRIEIDADEAQRQVDQWQQILGSGAIDAVDQISVLAERFQKEEAPEGIGHPGVHMRTSIKSQTVNRDPYTKVIRPTKRTDDGWLLHRAVVGNPSTPDYDLDFTKDYPPEVPIWIGADGQAAGPIAQWAAAKLGNRDAAWAIGWRWALDDGQETFPNRFIDRSFRQWEGRAEDVAQDAVDRAFSTGGL